MAFAAAPVVTAIFANSAFEKLAPNGFQSFRAEVWRRTDPDRCGILPAVFEPDFSFARYVDAILSLPLIFTYKGGVYRPVHGLPASRWFAADLPAELRAEHAGLEPVPEDLEWVINQSFRDARLRHYLECRAADFPLPEIAAAPVALWTGLLYDPAARARVMETMGGLSLEARRTLAADVAKRGLRAKAGDRTVLAIARDLASVARASLIRRGRGEEVLLDGMDALLAAGKSSADVLLESFPARADAAALIERLRLRG